MNHVSQFSSLQGGTPILARDPPNLAELRSRMAKLCELLYEAGGSLGHLNERFYGPSPITMGQQNSSLGEPGLGGPEGVLGGLHNAMDELERAAQRVSQEAQKSAGIC